MMPPAIEASPRARAALIKRAERVIQTRGDPRPWIEDNLWIRDKQRRVIRLRLNWAQQFYYGRRTPRDIILKARQMGFTTIIGALFFADCMMRPNTASVIVAHDLDSAERIFRIVQLFWERLPEEERKEAGKPRFSNRREFLWPKRNSHFYVGTAGALAFGRGMTINNLHCSEFAFWPKPEEALIALTEAVPAEGRIIIESTANGRGNYFHQLWEKAVQRANAYEHHFFVWWEDPSYALAGPALGALTASEQQLKAKYKLSDDQLRWRRAKQRELRDRFDQEYPEDHMTCFLTTGRGCFDREALARMAARIAAGPRPQIMAAVKGREEQLVPTAPARLLVWRPPQLGQLYVIGADVGEGLASGDASCAVVLERESGEQVAELHGRVPPDRFGHLLDALGRWYNQAQLAVERNNHGHSTLNTLRNVCHYPRLYWHVRYDVAGQVTPILGWPTDQSTKPILVDDLAAAIAEGSITMHSADLVDECLSFVTTDTGAQQAQEGAHDDRVMGAGIAWQVRKRPVARGLTERPPGW